MPLDRAPLLKTEMEADRALRAAFAQALAHDLDAARRDLPRVAGKPWLEEMNFHEMCALARDLEQNPPPAAPPASGALPGADDLVLAAGLHNAALALREFDEYLPLHNGARLLEQFVSAAPGEAILIASGHSTSARRLHDLLAASPSPEMTFLARLADDPSTDLPRRGRVAVFAGPIARGELSLEAALKIAGSPQRFYSTVLDMRVASHAKSDRASLDRILAEESLLLCRAAQESLQRTLLSDLAQFRARDLYAVLALGRAEATPQVFAAVFDRLLLPKWRAETPPASSLLALLDQTANWELGDFAAGALAAGRFEPLLSVAGPGIVTRLARGIEQSTDPLREAMRVAEIIDAAPRTASLQQLASVISQEFARCRDAGDLRGATLYGLLAAKFPTDPIGAPYLPYLQSSETIDTGILFGKDNDCIERHFFYDDDDGVASFEAFRKIYAADPAWEIEDRGTFLHITGRGIEGRRIEIFANVPIDGHLPKNRGLEGEARRRQQAIAAVLAERGLIAPVIVHRGHAFWVERTLGYVTPANRLVILGSCGGATEVHAVIEASHDAQVIATRGVAETEINNSILKAFNERLLKGDRILRWDSFWAELKAEWGKGGLFGEYIAPNQDSGSVFLRAFYRYLDSRQP